jgi:TolB-like protein/predicted Ser/Thr protein kinase
MSSPFRKVEALFHRVLDLPEPERHGLLERACAGDPALLRDVQALLDHHKEETAAFRAAIQPVASELLASAPDSLLAGDATLGRYRLDRKLGEGGMGAVYLGTDSRLGRNVAVKVINRISTCTPEARGRFVREARSAAALCHPNIASIYDVGESGEIPWIVMEYVHGGSLRSLMTGSRSERAWMHYASQIASALAHAHARGIIHRDIKPDNILVTEDDQVKVIDFGLARAVPDQASESETITRPDAFVGTLAYAAPELIAGGSASARSDIYSAGVLLYEMACGEHPFAGLKGHALVSAISTGSYVSCRKRSPPVPAAIAAVVDRAMEREPAARYKNGAELAAALQRPEASQYIRAADATPTLVVLDFENIGGSPHLEWLSSGMAETLSTDLARLRSVRVVSRGHVVERLRRLGHARKDAAAAVDIGRELGAGRIVTGGYQRIADRVRITVALIDASSGDALAMDKIDGRWDELFDVQDRVTEAVLKSLALSSADEQRILPAETRNLVAYEHYVRARQLMYEMQSQSVSGAIGQFEQAIRLDPDYALAYSGLGTAHALQFIRTSSPDDIQRASQYLERATELDPELAEPYPWLANIRLRKNDPAGSLAAGRRGVELQPDLSVAHYFYGATFYMAPEVQPGGLRTALPHLVEAIHLDSRLHAAYIVLGASALFLGMHDDAIRVLSEAVRRESGPDLLYPFVGARTLRAFAQTRAGLWKAANEGHLDALEALRNTNHIYTSSFETLSACGLGEIELRAGNESAALTYFRRARRIITESRRTAGSARLLIRIDTGLACAYARLGDQERARQLADAAAAQIGSLDGQTATATFECSFALLWLGLACAQVRLGDLEAAVASLERAHQSGWLDAAWLRIDPELRPLRDHRVFRGFVEELDAAPPVVLPPLVYRTGARLEPASGARS